MPTHGNDYGIDTDKPLTALNAQWAAIAGWRPAIPPNPANPVFAGRYFSNPALNRVWTRNETAGVKNANPDLKYVLPIAVDLRNQVEGGPKKADGTDKDPETVRSWGAANAKTTCDNIVQAVRNNELVIPFFWQVIVYLDVEWNWKLSPNYWYGWASTVYWYCTGSFALGFHPFLPGLYCATMHDPTSPLDVLHARIPVGPADPHGGDVQTGLTKSPNNLASRCWGFYTSNPEDPHRFDGGFEPDWDHRFESWSQTVHIIFDHIPWSTVVPVRIWQYASTPGTPAFNVLLVDLDETSPDFTAVSRMLRMP